MNQEEWTDEQLIVLLKKDSGKAVEKIFQKYYTFLCKVVYRILPDAVLVEDLVQEVFMELWRKHPTIRVQSSLKAYLKRATVNKTLNYIRDNKMKFESEDSTYKMEGNLVPVNKQMEANELQQLVQVAVDYLPERCRIIFTLSRFEQLSYKEIAQKLDISVKTVENQISKAIKILKKQLGPYLE